MNQSSNSQSGIFNPRVLVAFALCLGAVLLAMLSFAANPPIETKASAADFSSSSVFNNENHDPLRGSALADRMALASMSGPGWSKVTSPDFSRGVLNAVACTSATQCWAVGGYAIFDAIGDDASQTLIEQWNGTSWSIVSSPNSGGGSNVLRAVTCTSATQCWAVGDYFNTTSSVYQTLIEQWNGTSWSIVTSANGRPGGSGPVHNHLYGVTCASATQCWAVGEYFIGFDNHTNARYNTVVLQWNGTSWTIFASPNSSNPDSVENNLKSVVCNSTSDCWAVGFVFNYYAGCSSDPSCTDPRYDTTLTEHWNGSAWSVVDSPDDPNAQYSDLNGVSCTSTSQCWAIGSKDGNTLIDQWNGTSWSTVTSPNTGAGAYLNSVTCSSVSACWATGQYLDGSTDIFQTLIERWNGSSWSVVTSPNTSSAQNNDLVGVTCVPGVACWAVGSHGIPNDLQQTLVEMLGFSGSWSIIASPNHIPPSTLNSVICPSPSQCWAVGDYSDGTAVNPLNQSVIQQWNGTSWSIVPLNQFGGSSDLKGVTCLSPSQCWTVGAYSSGNYSRTLIEQLTGTSWSLVASPNTSTTDSDNLLSVACASASQCFTVGNYLDSSLNGHPLAEQWNGSAWSIITLPANNTQLSSFNGVTCPSSSQCWVVGYYIAGSGIPSYYQTLILHWDGTSWSIAPSANTSSTQLNILSAVICNSTSDCWAVGSYQNSSFIYQTLTEHWNGTSWSVITSPNSGTQNNFLNSVTCSSASDCWAIGYDGVNGSYQTLTEHWNGTAWSIVSSANPGAPNNNVLNGVACASAANCWAVGDYNNGNTDQALIEEFIAPLLVIDSVSRPANGHFIITGHGLPSFSISIQTSSNLVTPCSNDTRTFCDLGATTSDANGSFQYDDATAAMLSKRFYRAVYP
jgi:hypothetical protein